MEREGLEQTTSQDLLYVAAVSVGPAKGVSERFYSKLLDEQTRLLFFSLLHLEL